MKKNNTRPLLSVCIPTYEMHGKGAVYLKHNFDILLGQSFKNFEVVISDNAKTDVIKKVCDQYRRKLDIKYFKNPDFSAGMATNINNSIKKATGEIIKILFLDDYLSDSHALQEIAENFDLKKDRWLLTGYHHTSDGENYFKPAYPKYNDEIYLGKNTIGSPSILAIKNENPLFFDVRLKWFVDCDYYKRCHDKFGEPKILNKILTTIRVGAHQVTQNEITAELEKNEGDYLLKKHGKKSSKNIDLKNVTLVAVSGINPQSAARSLELSMAGIDFYDVVLISHFKPEDLDSRITFRQCQPDELKSTDPRNKNDYSKFMAYQLANYIDSDFVLIVHNNGLVLRPNKWRKEFLNYDYIGAPWPKGVHFTNEGVNVRVGNGGFSLRSKKMLNVLNDLKLPFTDNGTGYFNEDGLMCVYYRKILEKNGIKFAPVSIASHFSHEANCPDSDPEPFGYHENEKIIPRFYFFKHSIRKFVNL